MADLSDKINLGGIASATSAITALSGLILVTPQAVVGYAPQTPASPDSNAVTLDESAPAILFHYEGEQAVAIDSDITDHYIEDNSAIQDQISIRPITITTHGFIGELNDVAPYGLQTLKTAANKLTGISAYAPQVSIAAQIAYNEALLAYQVAAGAVNAGVAAVSSISNAISGSNGQTTVDAEGHISEGSVQSKQQQIFSQFYGYWVDRTLFSVQTPWCVFQNMAIKSLRAIQDADTRMITDFEVQFKQIRVAQTALEGTPVSLAGRASAQASKLKNNGASSGKPAGTVAGAISKTVTGGV